MTSLDLRKARVSTAAAAASILSTGVTASVCALPFAGILLGVSGLGWLTQYAYLRVPLSALTGALLVTALLHFRKLQRSCARKPSATSRFLLWAATALALTVNLFEYVIMPRLG